MSDLAWLVGQTEGMSHCCFAGCRPLQCGCCADGFGHEPTCSQNPGAQMGWIRLMRWMGGTLRPRPEVPQ